MIRVDENVVPGRHRQCRDVDAEIMFVDVHDVGSGRDTQTSRGSCIQRDDHRDRTREQQGQYDDDHARKRCVCGSGLGHRRLLHRMRV